METRFLSVLCFTRRTSQNTHNAAGEGSIGSRCPARLEPCLRGANYLSWQTAFQLRHSVLCCEQARPLSMMLSVDFTWWFFFFLLSWVEQDRLSSWKTTNRNYSRSDHTVSPNTGETVFPSCCVPFKFLLNRLICISTFAAVIEMNIKMSYWYLCLIIFLFFEVVGCYLWGAWGFLTRARTHTLKLAIYASSFCFESNLFTYFFITIFDCHCFLITFLLGFAAVQNELKKKLI